MNRTGSGNQIGSPYAQPSAAYPPQTQQSQPGNDGAVTLIKLGNSNLNPPTDTGTGPDPTRGRLNQAPGYPGYNPRSDPPSAPQSTPPKSQPLNAACPTGSKIGDVEKGKDDDTETNTNDDDNDAENESADKSKGRRRRKIVSAANVCCCALRSGVVTIGFFNVVLAFIAIIIFGMSFSAHKESLCHQLGLGCGFLFILISMFLIIGGFSRSSVICIIYLILSWFGFIGATVVILVLDQCENQKGALLYMLLACGYLFKIYEAVVIYYFIKEPTPPLEAVRRPIYGYSYPASYSSYPVYVSDAAPVFVPYGGYGYGYSPYGYAYDPALGMLTGMGLGMAMSGGYDHCDHYDSCYW